MNTSENKERGTKHKRNRPDAPLYKPPAIRNTHNATKPIFKENQLKKCFGTDIKSTYSTKEMESSNLDSLQEKSKIEIGNVSNIPPTKNPKVTEDATKQPLEDAFDSLDSLVGKYPEENNISKKELSNSYDISAKTETVTLKNKISNLTIKTKIENHLITKNSLSKTNFNDIKGCVTEEIDLSKEFSKNTKIDDALLKMSVIKENSKNNSTDIEEVKSDCNNKQGILIKRSERIQHVENKIYPVDINKKNKDTDEDVEVFLRAAEGLNRCNKRLVKNSLNKSDVLIIEDSALNEEKVDDWEELLDDTKLLSSPIFSKLNKSQENILPSLPEEVDEDAKQGCVDSSISHIIEIYGFPNEFQTRDLITIFEHYRSDTYHIKWVDDNHALGVFPSEAIALDVLKIQHPLIKLRPMNEASKQAIAKTKKNPNAMLPVIARPQTCPQTARRMVTGALGLKLHNSKEEREEERKILREAREKKKLALKQQDDAWEGKIS